MIKRLLAFLRGDMTRAEDLSGYPKIESPPVIIRARTDKKLGELLLAAASEARDRTDAILAGVQTKASGFLTLVIGLFPLFLAAIALAVPPETANWVRWLAFATLAAAAIALAGSAIAAALASGMGLTASLNLAYLEKEGEQSKTLERLTADEAETWNYASVLNLETSRRRARDLFRARQLAVVALLLAGLGITTLLASVGGRPSLLVTDPASASATSPPDRHCESMRPMSCDFPKYGHKHRERGD
jgi:hypothetical protein